MPFFLAFPCLILSVHCFAQSSVSPGEALLLGPLPNPSPIFSGKPARPVPGFMDEKIFEGKAISWLGTEYKWKTVSAKNGRFTIEKTGGKQLACLCFYFHNPRWEGMEFTLRSSEDARLFLESSSLGKTQGKSLLKQRRFLCRGTYKTLIILYPEGEGRSEIEFSIKPFGVERPGKPYFDLSLHGSPARFGMIWKRKRFSNITISPEGSLVAYTCGNELFVRNTRDNRMVFRCPARGISMLKFLDKSRLGYVSKQGLMVLDVKDGSTRKVLQAPSHCRQISWDPDKNRVFWLESPPREQRPKIFRMTELRQKLRDWNTKWRIWLGDLKGGGTRPVTGTGDFQITSFSLSRDGETMALVKKVPMKKRPWFKTEIWLVDTSTFKGWHALTLRTGFESWPGNLSFSPDGKKLAFVAPPSEVWPVDSKEAREAAKSVKLRWLRESFGEHNYHNADLYLFDITKKKLKNLTKDFDPGVVSGRGSPWWSLDGGKIYFLAMSGRRRTFFTASPGKEPPEFKAWHSGPIVADMFVPAIKAPEPTVLFVSGSFTRLPYLAFIRGIQGIPREVFDPNKDFLAGLDLTEPADYQFINSDGIRIDGWLYLPGKKKAGARFPLIVYYYGGAVATTERLVWTHQYLVANGYALYVINPRGAGEYGRDFADSHVNDWGKRATRDIIEGIEMILKDHKELDGSRIGCYGGSYGGFTTLDLLTKTTRIKAAVSLFGISNIASYWGGGTWGWTYGDMALARNYPWSNPGFFTNRSPLFNAHKIKTPLLLLHGLADVNVPRLEADQMFTALKILGSRVEYVMFSGEDHGISGTRQNRETHRTMILEWFDKYLKNEPEAWDHRWK